MFLGQAAQLCCFAVTFGFAVISAVFFLDIFVKRNSNAFDGAGKSDNEHGKDLFFAGGFGKFDNFLFVKNFTFNKTCFKGEFTVRFFCKFAKDFCGATGSSLEIASAVLPERNASSSP